MEHSPGGQTTSVGTNANANTTMNRMRMPNAKERKEGREGGRTLVATVLLSTLSCTRCALAAAVRVHPSDLVCLLACLLVCLLIMISQGFAVPLQPRPRSLHSRSSSLHLPGLG